MQVGVYNKCMHTSFGGCGLFSFGDVATFQKWPNFPFSPQSSKNLMDRNWLKKFMQVGIYVTCMQTNFGGHGLSGFGDIATFKKSQISLFTHGIVHGHQKFNALKLAQKNNASRC